MATSALPPYGFSPGQVGPATGADGSPARERMGRDWALVTQDGHAQLQEAVFRGKCFSACQTTATTMPAGLSASPTTTTLYNPLNSGVNGVIWYGGVTNLIVFAAAATVWVAVNNNVVAAATTGTALQGVNLLAGSGNNPVISALTTATLPAAPTRALAILGAGLTGAITTIPTTAPLGRWFNGSIILGPGCSLSFQSSTVGPTTGTVGEWIWEEIPSV